VSIVVFAVLDREGLLIPLVLDFRELPADTAGLPSRSTRA